MLHCLLACLPRCLVPCLLELENSIDGDGDTEETGFSCSIFHLVVVRRRCSVFGLGWREPVQPVKPVSCCHPTNQNEKPFRFLVREGLRELACCCSRGRFISFPPSPVGTHTKERKQPQNFDPAIPTSPCFEVRV